MEIQHHFSFEQASAGRPPTNPWQVANAGGIVEVTDRTASDGQNALHLGDAEYQDPSAVAIDLDLSNIETLRYDVYAVKNNPSWGNIKIAIGGTPYQGGSNIDNVHAHINTSGPGTGEGQWHTDIDLNLSEYTGMQTLVLLVDGDNEAFWDNLRFLGRGSGDESTDDQAMTLGISGPEDPIIEIHEGPGPIGCEHCPEPRTFSDIVKEPNKPLHNIFHSMDLQVGARTGMIAAVGEAQWYFSPWKAPSSGTYTLIDKYYLEGEAHHTEIGGVIDPTFKGTFSKVVSKIIVEDRETPRNPIVTEMGNIVNNELSLYTGFAEGAKTFIGGAIGTLYGGSATSFATRKGLDQVDAASYPHHRNVSDTYQQELEFTAERNHTYRFHHFTFPAVMAFSGVGSKDVQAELSMLLTQRFDIQQ